jgi:RHS repeat-associated protein
MVTDGNHVVVARHDYTPFGEEIPAGYAERGTEWGGYDRVNQKFTAKERDQETGLDYFGARYMSSAQGRFTTVDPVMATASLFDPQSWNAYSYTLNNPLKYVDKDGHVPILAITAGVGALAGGIVGAAREYGNQIQESGHITSSGRIWTAAGGGALSGGLAGLTLGIGAGTGVAAGVVETGIVTASTTVIGDFAQHRTNDALGLSNSGESETELRDTLVDAASAGLAGSVAGKLADRLIPIPNVKKEIELLKFASRRSTRAAQIQSAQSNAQLRALGNTAVGNTVGPSMQQGLLYFWSLITGAQQQKQKSPRACVTTDAVGGGKETVCQ